jgi:hypothetical protein
MLPPFIIDQIRRREEELRQRQEQPRLELPIDAIPPKRKRDEEMDEDEGTDRGVIILDLL